MNHLDLFSGIGGFALAVDEVWPGSTHTFCEIDPYCQALLKKRYPRSVIYGDIRSLTAYPTSDRCDGQGSGIEVKEGLQQRPEPTGIMEGRLEGRNRDIRTLTNTEHKGRPSGVQTEAVISCGEGCKIDLLTGGFPCQPFSQAGKRRGTDDNRFLWPEMLRVIKEFKPTWIIGENVAGILSVAEFQGDAEVGSETDLFGNKTDIHTQRGRGVLFRIIGELEQIGYSVQTFVIPACSLNAPHRRDRVWIVANKSSPGLQKPGQTRVGELSTEDCGGSDDRPEQSDRDASNSTSVRLQRPMANGELEWNRHSEHCTVSDKSGQNTRPEWEANWLEVATELCGMDDEFSTWLDRHIKVILEEVFRGIPNNKNRAEDLQVLSKAIQSPEVWEKVGRLLQVEDKAILLKVLFGIEVVTNSSLNIQPQGKECGGEEVMRSLWRNAHFMRSPQRREHQEQLAKELKSIVSKLSYETALEITKAWDCLQCGFSSMTSPAVELDGLKLSKSRHRVERLKALGNAIVPAVAVEIMKAIKKVDDLCSEK